MAWRRGISTPSSTACSPPMSRSPSGSPAAPRPGAGARSMTSSAPPCGSPPTKPALSTGRSSMPTAASPPSSERDTCTPLASSAVHLATSGSSGSSFRRRDPQTPSCVSATAEAAAPARPSCSPARAARASGGATRRRRRAYPLRRSLRLRPALLAARPGRRVRHPRTARARSGGGRHGRGRGRRRQRPGDRYRGVCAPGRGLRQLLLLPVRSAEPLRGVALLRQRRPIPAHSGCLRLPHRRPPPPPPPPPPPRRGAFPPRSVVPADRLIDVDGLAGTTAALIEPASVAWHAVQRLAAVATPLLGRVAVIGSGPIGLLVTVAVRARSAEVQVFNTDIAERPLEVARAVGATHTALARDAERELPEFAPAIVFETSGSRPGFDLALRSVAPGGTVVAVGQLPPDIASSVQLIVGRELVVTGSSRF